MNASGRFITPSCCERHSVSNMDHSKGLDHQGAPMVNRICLRCGTHWYGPDGVNVVEFTRKAWDRWMNSLIKDAA